MRELTATRAGLGAAAVLSPTVAAQLLPFRGDRGLEWLREEGLILEVRGLGRLVIWGDVVEALRAAARGPGIDLVRPQSPRRATLRRVSLRET